MMMMGEAGNRERVRKDDGSGKGSKGWMVKLMLVIVGLVALNLWHAVTRDVGPDPEVEALHSPEEATSQCQASIESRFASRRPSIVGLLQAEYVQGGEYEVQGTIELRDGARRLRHEVLCVAQFTATDGWDAEEIFLETN